MKEVNKSIGERYEKEAKDRLSNLGFTAKRAAGSHGEPDLIARKNGTKAGIEVKACRFFVSNGGLDYKIGSIKFERGQFEGFKSYCKDEDLKPVIIVFLYQKRTVPIMLRLPTDEIEKRLEDSDKITLSIYQILRNATNKVEFEG